MSLSVLFSGVNFESTTGPNSFARRLANSLEQKDVKVYTTHKDFTGCVAIVFIEPNIILPPTVKIIHRLDGIWFKPEEFYTKNAIIKWQYERAHHVVFQSEFDCSMITKWWSYPREWSVIRNGIKIEEKLIDGNDVLNTLVGTKLKLSVNSKIFACAADWHGQKRLDSNVLLFKRFSKVDKNAKLIILGDPKWEKQKIYAEEQHNVFCLGRQSHDICLGIYNLVAKSGGWFIHLAWADHCPNTVIEAISQGCPTICSSVGGTAEIVGTNGRVINEQPYNYNLYNYDVPPTIDVSNFDVHQAPPKVNPANVSIEEASRKYYELIAKITRENR